MFIASKAGSPKDTILSFEPLPNINIVLLLKSISLILIFTNSETLIPEPYNISKITLSLCPSLVFIFGILNISSIDE